jgi:hypothetical protein
LYLGKLRILGLLGFLNFGSFWEILKMKIYDDVKKKRGSNHMYNMFVFYNKNNVWSIKGESSKKNLNKFEVFHPNKTMHDS